MSIAATLSCSPNQRIVNSSADTPVPVNAEPVVITFEGDLQAMRNADFNYVYVFRRKDGGTIDADDKKFFHDFTPTHTNRRRLSDDG